MEIVLNGIRCTSLPEAAAATQPEVVSFLEEWYDDKDYMIGHTSGSTGTPKEIRLLKKDMESSARLTNAFFSVTSGTVMLLCLSPAYIAGKMMIIRAILSGADLLTIPPSSSPLREIDRPVDFAAMVPMQVRESLGDEVTRKRLAAVGYLIIGGSAVSPQMERELSCLPTRCFATYGMTETVSHIALRELNTAGNNYFALGEVTFYQDERRCLCICAPHLAQCRFVTNDVVRLINDRNFEWLGRYDLVINSGGVKLFPEEIEKKLSGLISSRFYIAGCPDDRFGEKAVLYIEDTVWDESEKENLFNCMKERLTPYQVPKEIHFISRFKETYSGKLIRSCQE